MKMPQVQADYFALSGGMDLVTPAISISPGKVIDSQNYEPAIGGGYGRILGYERFDGRVSPTAASYWVLPVVVTGAISVGDTIIGNTSAVTGVVLGIFTGYLVCGRVIGAFVVAESLNISAIPVATISGAQLLNGAVTPSQHADYKLLSANDQRQFVLTVPGSGRIRGVFVYNDKVYAFRDNAGGTAGNMYQSTSTGWLQIVFKTEIAFNTGTIAPTVGQVIKGGTSTATATVVAVLLRTGAWSGTGVGTLVVVPISGAFTNGELIKDSSGTITLATATTTGTAITRSPGGNGVYFAYNFSGSTATLKMYGVDGVNPAFEFDGTNYVPIRTGMLVDAPSHVIAHKSYLFLAFLGSVQFSGIGTPYGWSITLGAGEFDCSRSVTGFLPQGGNQVGSSLAIFTEERTFVLYGTSAADFKLVSSIFDIGYSAYTCQQVSNDAYGVTRRGIQQLMTTLNYGDFDYESVSHMVQPFMTVRRGLETASNSLRTKNQYRVYFSDGYCLAVGLTGDKIFGLMPLNYSRPVRCIHTSTLSTGQEVTYFGSDDGYVYLDNIGTSQDGAVIESWLRLPFNNEKSPRVRKRFRRAILETTVESFASLQISYELGYGTPEVASSAAMPDNALVGSGGYWDQFAWDQFNWDTQYVANPSLSLDGSEKSISLIFYSSRAQDGPHILQGVTILNTPQRLERS